MTRKPATLYAAQTEGLTGPAPALVVCEHASDAMPAEFADLGLSGDVLHSHVAWDPGALALSRHLARALSAPLVAGTVSRLIYDCNRPPEAADAVPARSEVYDIPGNQGLDAAARADRARRVYVPFCNAVELALDTARPKALITVHSFTPVYFGQPRPVEIGILHDADHRLADALLQALEDSPHDIRRNAPYGPEDGVTHTLKARALPRGLLNVMLEVRNDLLADADGIARIGALLAPALRAALAAAQTERAG